MEGGSDKPFPFDLGSAFANLSRYLASSEKVALASTCTLLRQVMMRGTIWQSFQICDINMKIHWGRYLKWIEKYLPLIQPLQLVVTLFEVQHEEDQELLQILMKPKEYIESVSIRSHSQLLHLVVAKTCPNTSTLILHSSQISDKVAWLMCQSMTKLSHLQITADSLCFTFQNASKYLKDPMQKLILKPHNIDYQQLLKIVKNQEVNHLNELQIDVQQCDQQTLVEIVSSLKHISRLRLYHFQRFDQLGYADLLASRLSPEMKELALTKCYHLDMTSIVHKIACRTLKALDLTEATRLTDNSVLQIATNCHHLRQINLSWCYELTDRSIKEVINRCPALERAIFNGLKSLTDAVFEEYATFKNIFKEKLYDLAKYEFRKECKHGKDAQLPEIYSKYGTKTALKQLFEPCPDLHTRKKTLSNLRYLECNSCNNISDKILKIVHCFSRTAQVINYYGEDVSLFRNSLQQEFID